MRFKTSYDQFEGDWSIKGGKRQKSGFATERDAVEWWLDASDDDSDYAEFVMKRSEGERIIGNGDQLIEVMESDVYFDEFVDHVLDKGGL